MCVQTNPNHGLVTMLITVHPNNRQTFVDWQIYVHNIASTYRNVPSFYLRILKKYFLTESKVFPTHDAHLHLFPHHVQGDPAGALGHGCVRPAVRLYPVPVTKHNLT